MFCLLHTIFAHVLARFLQHVHARKRESLSFSHYSFNQMGGGGGEEFKRTSYTKLLLCKKSETWGFFDFSFGHSDVQKFVLVSATRFTCKGFRVCSFREEYEMEDGREVVYRSVLPQLGNRWMNFHGI
jgi:hypothetical protein